MSSSERIFRIIQTMRNSKQFSETQLQDERERLEVIEAAARERAVRERMRLPERPWKPPPELPENPILAHGVEASVRRRLRVFRRPRP